MKPVVEIREYRPAQDYEACRRAWTESGWVDGAKNEEAFRLFTESARSVVGTVGGSAECLVNVHPATLRYLDGDIRLACVTGVTTSRVVRRQGLAGRVTARALAEEALAGTPVAALGVFEQGFYNRLGFGNGPYETWCTLDPAQLEIQRAPRIPVRLTSADWEAVHGNRLRRRLWHGAASILSGELTRADMLWNEKAFGLGYRDDDGVLTHHIWCSAEKPRRGPYTVDWMAFRSREEFHELMALIHSLADQIHSLEIHEPPGLQIQDLLRQPFKGRRMTEASPHVQRMSSSAYWQLRILDLPQALTATHLPGDAVRFNLELSDPIEAMLPPDSRWRGVAGSYVVTLGPESGVKPGTDAALATLRASVNAFSRAWLGVRSATALSWTDTLDAPPGLLRALDRVLCLPAPASDWDY
ncbi:MAG: GNAT family N-acetyltransferase [Candidatus Bipolaricaulis sp.]|nr:GNAT family N-acetyltransferase [Candidatus Bipolaricaulis sp.]